MDMVNILLSGLWVLLLKFHGDVLAGIQLVLTHSKPSPAWIQFSSLASRCTRGAVSRSHTGSSFPCFLPVGLELHFPPWLCPLVLLAREMPICPQFQPLQSLSAACLQPKATKMGAHAMRFIHPFQSPSQEARLCSHCRAFRWGLSHFAGVCGFV